MGNGQPGEEEGVCAESKEAPQIQIGANAENFTGPLFSIMRRHYERNRDELMDLFNC